jgi:NTP pyrophosphatase (non-canonical NTP hydrolase)
MTLNEYQQKALETAVYPNKGDNLFYSVFGLSGEVGEVCGEVKKIIRNDNNMLTPERHKKIMDELSDVLWYLADTATALKVDLESLAAYNLDKLNKRKDTGTLKAR